MSHLPLLAQFAMLLTAFGLVLGAFDRLQPKSRPQSLSVFWLCV